MGKHIIQTVNKILHRKISRTKYSAFNSSSGTAGSCCCFSPSISCLIISSTTSNTVSTWLAFHDPRHLILIMVEIFRRIRAKQVVRYMWKIQNPRIRSVNRWIGRLQKNQKQRKTPTKNPRIWNGGRTELPPQNFKNGWILNSSALHRSFFHTPLEVYDILLGFIRCRAIVLWDPLVDCTNYFPCTAVFGIYNGTISKFVT